MSYQKFLDKIEYLKYLIKNENTGSAKELADKLGVSRRTLFNYFDVLKHQNYIIKYCRFRKTYYFDNN